MGSNPTADIFVIHLRLMSIVLEALGVGYFKRIVPIFLVYVCYFPPSPRSSIFFHWVRTLGAKQEAHNPRRILEMCPSDLMHKRDSDAMEDIPMGHMV